MTAYQDRKRMKEIHDNPPADWRETWSPRQKINLFSNETSALRYAEKVQKKYEQPLHIDIHPKDGFVVYYNLPEEESNS